MGKSFTVEAVSECETFPLAVAKIYAELEMNRPSPSCICCKRW